MVEFLSLHDVTAMHGAEIQAAVHRVVESGWYLQGKENAEFEVRYAEFIGTKHAVGCANGLDALTLIFRAYIEMGMLCPGDEVLVPANTYIATILSITENGLRPVLVEPRIDTLQIDDSIIEQHITPRTRALCIVHLYGRNACTQKVLDLCTKYGLLLVEDNAQAHGCRCMATGQRTGSIGNAAAHSFYPGKNLGALGDGGCVTTNDKDFADVVRTLANYGSSKKYVFKYQGRNSRLDEIQAAVLNVKLKYIDEDNERRREIARFYNNHITAPILLPQHPAESEENVWHIYPVMVPDGRRDALRECLAKNGIGTLIHYPIPPHKQECYSQMASFSLPITEQIAREELSLPISPAMTLEQAAIVSEAVNAAECLR